MDKLFVNKVPTHKFKSYVCRGMIAAEEVAGVVPEQFEKAESGSFVEGERDGSA